MTRVGRNHVCPCGSGKKYKHCCGQLDQAQAAGAHSIHAAIPRLLLEANALVEAGRLSQAEALCQQVLTANPDHPEALHLLGRAALRCGNNERAAQFIGSALRLAQHHALWQIDLGDALRGLGQIESALASYSRAQNISLESADVSFNVGTALAARGLHELAVSSYRQAQKSNGHSAALYYNTGNSLIALGRMEEAAECYRRAIKIKPDLAEAHNNLGKTFKALSRIDEAMASYRRALAIRPDYPEAHNNLGNILSELGHNDLAIASYQRALAGNPHYAVAHNNLGFLLGAMGQYDDAVTGFRRALELHPNFAEAHYNLGVALAEQGRVDAALESYQRALSLRPGYAEAYANVLFARSYQSMLSVDAYLALARGWEQACVPAPDRAAALSRIFARPVTAVRRLRVGYVSGDFREHPVAYFIAQLFAQHDPARVELFAYSTNCKADAVTVRVQDLVDHWVPVAGMSDDAVRDRIEADAIDVLIDLSGHTAHNRMGVFARRAAPVQAHYLGYFASTGLTAMDYWIGDDILTPPAADAHFSERVWRLPRVWVCYQPAATAPESRWRPANDGTLCVGSFNSLGKITPHTIALWSSVLQALPEAKLVLKNKGLSDSGNRDRMLQAFAGHGISGERIELRPVSAWTDYMAQHDDLDIALDPVGGHGGGTSTCDALWMGVPVIHMLGDRATSRFAASLLHALGHREWVAHSASEYVDKVVRLARDVELRRVLRATQRERVANSALCNAKDLALHLEDAYFEMFARWQGTRSTVGRPAEQSPTRA